MFCEGSWVNSARNIVYYENKLECELKRKDGTWNKKRLTFIPKLKYHNINGNFKWKNCKNNVVFNSTSHYHISRRYPRVSIQECLDNINNKYDDWFTIDSKIINYKKENCISISLFKKHIDNNYENQYDVDNNKWNNKYYNNLIKNLNNFNLDNFNVNLYLANDLKDLLPIFKKYIFLNIFIMKSESVGAQPGMLWRYIDITNKSYKSVFIADIDESWNWINNWFHNVEDNYTLYTLKPGDSAISKENSCAWNFATIIGSHIKVNPIKYNFNIIDVMKGFISFCKKREKSINPYCFNDNDPITYWNHPVRKHEYGWGRIITKYGFDELFLKHVIYHYVYPSIKFYD